MNAILMPYECHINAILQSVMPGLLLMNRFILDSYLQKSSKPHLVRTPDRLGWRIQRIGGITTQQGVGKPIAQKLVEVSVNIYIQLTMVMGMLRDEISHLWENKKVGFLCHWIGLREFLQETPIFDGKIDGFRLRFSLKSIHCKN